MDGVLLKNVKNRYVHSLEMRYDRHLRLTFLARITRVNMSSRTQIEVKHIPPDGNRYLTPTNLTGARIKWRRGWLSRPADVLSGKIPDPAGLAEHPRTL
jgi:hypothetical protein